MERKVYEIIGESRHQFIYGYNGISRKKFLENLAKEYPISINVDKPMAIYLEDIGLPNLEIDQRLDKIKLFSTSKEYLNCIIAQNILKNILLYLDKKTLDERKEILLSKINTLYLNQNYSNISSLEELLNAIVYTKTTYYEFYEQYLKEKITSLNIDKLIISFLDIDSFICCVKELLKNKSYFCIIADQQQEISTISRQAINSLINMRINANLSIKVVCNPEEWNTYYDFSGLCIDDIHDYSKVELDDCYKNYTKTLQQKRGKI